MRSLFRWSFALTCFVAMAWSVSSQESAVGPETLNLATEIEVTSVKDPEGGYSVSAVISDLDTREVLAAPTIVFQKGSPGESWSETSNKDVVHFKIEVGEEESTLSYSVSVTRKEVVISQHSARIQVNVLAD